MPLLEVCASDLASVHAARIGGAQRVELCSGLSEGGITPSLGLVRQALSVGGVQVHVLIRPRGGDFLYSSDEIDAMLSDIASLRQAGVHGVVIGALTPNGDIDLDTCRALIAEAHSMHVTFNRAFDLCRSPHDALEELITLGCTHLLTSGCAQSAIAGCDMLASLQRQAASRITLIAAGGVNPDCAASIVKRTGVSQLHASARAPLPSAMTYHRPGVAMGAPGSDEYSRLTTSANIVRRIVQSINS